MKKRTLLIPIIAIVSFSLSMAGDPEPNTRTWGFQSRLLTNPEVQAMVDAVSGEDILNNVQILVSYYTRHTNSDTVSNNYGVGATRRWIYGRFEEIAADSQTYDLEPSYFDFNATVCGIPRLHRNVLATLPGISTPQRHLIVMGHFDSRTINGCDSTSYAPSANDDGSGTAVVVEIAKILSRYPFESTVIIMPVTGEDEGLYGSTAYAQWAQNQGMRIDGVITNDVVGNIEGCSNPSCPPGDSVIIDSLSVRHFSGGPETGRSRQMTRYMKLKAMEYVTAFNISLVPAIDRPGRSGDHVPFYDRGYAGVRFTEAHENGDGSGYNGRQHNGYDTISAINTNSGYMANIARINIAGIASLALAPETPTGALTAVNVGDGTSVLLTWPDNNNEPDFAGYRVAVRPLGELFYTNVMDAGNSNSHLVTGLTDGQRAYLSISAYDTEDNESIFTEEIQFTPTSVPQTPQDLTSTSYQDRVLLQWTLNAEGDISAYRIFRRQPGQNDTALVAELPHPTAQWNDSTLTPHILYSYYIAAVDSDSNQSPLSSPVLGQLATHDRGIMIVDATPDGSGGPFQPTDQQVDDFYENLLIGYNVRALWDRVDSNAVGRALADAYLAPYSSVLFHCDRVANHIERDTTVLRQYLATGGKLIISGWNLSLAFAGNAGDFVGFPEGSFFREILKVDSLGVSAVENRDFVSAPSMLPGVYPDLIIDSSKVTIFENRLYKMEAFIGPLVDEPLTQPLNSYASSMGDQSPLNGEPVALRYLGDFRLVLFDVPLYFMKQESAVLAVQQALADIGELPLEIDSDNSGGLPALIGILGNYPNPFNSSTLIKYRLTEAASVSLIVYDILGRKIAELVDSAQPAGDHQALWSPGSAPSGIYFCRLQFGTYSQVARLVLIR